MFRRRRQSSAAPAESGASGHTPVSAPGWDAIDTAADSVHGGGAEPLHVSPGPGPHAGGGLQGISAYRADDHWHLVSYGLSELYDKVSGDPATSGWGYELTFRVPADSGQPPAWAFNLLEQIARQTQHAGVVFAAGHRLDPGGPIDGDRSPLTALAFTLDPQLGSIDTPNGRVEFLQVVGITSDQLAQMKAETTDVVLKRIAATNPLLVSRPA